MAAKHWIQGAINPAHEGALHRATHTPEDKLITAKKLMKAEHSKNPTLARQARLAETLHKLHHGTS